MIIHNNLRDTQSTQDIIAVDSSQCSQHQPTANPPPIPIPTEDDLYLNMSILNLRQYADYIRYHSPKRENIQRVKNMHESDLIINVRGETLHKKDLMTLVYANGWLTDAVIAFYVTNVIIPKMIFLFEQCLAQRYIVVVVVVVVVVVSSHIGSYVASTRG